MLKTVLTLKKAKMIKCTYKYKIIIFVNIIKSVLPCWCNDPVVPTQILKANVEPLLATLVP